MDSTPRGLPRYSHGRCILTALVIAVIVTALVTLIGPSRDAGPRQVADFAIFVVLALTPCVPLIWLACGRQRAE